MGRFGTAVRFAVELRDIEIFLTLAEELHFGKTAERLHVSPARISQVIKKQERMVGADLFERTSRVVRLTAIGRQLRDDLAPIYRNLHESVARAQLAAQGKTDALEVGLINLNAHDLRDFWQEFRTRHPRWGLHLRYCGFTYPFETLRSGEVDVLIAWLPVEEPDLTVGPILFTEPKRVIVGVDHELASLKSASIEVLGNYPTLTAGTAVPEYWEAEFSPFATPSGRKVEKTVVISTVEEIFGQVSLNGVVHVLGVHTERYNMRPDVKSLRLLDAPLLRWALVWRTEAEDDRIRALAQVVRDLGTVAL